MPSLTSPRFMTLADVCEELALSPAMGYSLVRSGELPAIQVGPKRVWRIERKKFEEYLDGLRDTRTASPQH